MLNLRENFLQNIPKKKLFNITMDENKAALPNEAYEKTKSGYRFKCS